MDLLRHPLATPQWESVRAAPVRLATRSVWTAPDDQESGAPQHRIVHQRAAMTDEPMRLDRLVVRPGAGYHKCASGQEQDSVRRVLVRVPEHGSWRTVADETFSEDPGTTHVIELGLQTTAVVVQIRRADTDEWWPGWNLAGSSLSLEGEAQPWQPSRQAALRLAALDLSGCPTGVVAEHRNGEVRYRTPYLEVGFRLRTPAFSHLGLDDDGAGRTSRNLLQLPRSMDIVRSGRYPSGVYPVMRDEMAEYLTQGPRLTAHDGRHPVGFFTFDFDGTTEVHGNKVCYTVDVPTLGQRYTTTFTVERDRLRIVSHRSGASTVRAWSSSAWHIALDNRVTPTAVLGLPRKEGETGLVASADLLWHFPRYGCLRMSTSGDGMWRSDSVRALDTNTLELKVGEVPTPEGDYLLPAGDWRAEAELVVGAPALATPVAGTPDVVARALSRHGLTGLGFRMDTGTLSNNGASMHCTTSLNDLSALARRLGAFPGDAGSPTELLRLSLERWLDGAPGYGGGTTSHGPHLLEDEYVQIAADTLLALARYLTVCDGAWAEEHAAAIDTAVQRMLARDCDGDGLIESTIRRGRSGEHQWSTAWCDVLSFGWKDAWANATWYEALRTLEEAYRHRGDPRQDTVRVAATRLQDAYVATFLNPQTGWFGGWRSDDDVLHDYCFPIVNGAACGTDLVPMKVAHRAMAAVWEELTTVGYDDLRNGLPLSLHRVPEADIGGVVFGLPMGAYQQGGASHHRSRVVVDALNRVGMRAEADELLVGLCTTIADDSSFGGSGSGLDWRMWDGTPSGYEGQLSEAFGVLACAVDRWGVR